MPGSWREEAAAASVRNRHPMGALPRLLSWLAPLLAAIACDLPKPATPAVDRPAAPDRLDPLSVDAASLDLEAHLELVRAKMPEGFHATIEEPFVVVGDGGPANVEQWARSTVRWAVDRLREAYFDLDPDHVIEVWLFRNGASYQKHTRELFGDRPTTRFGYYSPRHRALIMNIDTGGGTLVHEIVHPFMAANFADCPAWFNEGMGALYEQCEDRDDAIHGLPNWRLAPLQRAIRDRSTVPLGELIASNDEAFYGLQRSKNYAQARYLCYWLQQRGELRRFYRAFVADQQLDPTGREALREILQAHGYEDLRMFQADWEAWVLGLRYP